MRLRYLLAFFLVTALITVSLIFWFHLTEAKGLPMRYLSRISYIALWSGRSIFYGPFTKWMERLSEAYIVVLTGLQGFVLGFIFDYWDYRRRRNQAILGG
jgi:hypothetical protein